MLIGHVVLGGAANGVPEERGEVTPVIDTIEEAESPEAPPTGPTVVSMAAICM